MSYVYDAQAGGYRLICGHCDHQSPVISTDERAARGIEWWCSDSLCEQIHLAHQRARLKIRLIEKGMAPEKAEVEVAKLRWDMMPDKNQATSPTREQIEQAETLERNS